MQLHATQEANTRHVSPTYALNKTCHRYKEFQTLRTKYDELKSNMKDVLWKWIPENIPSNICNIPLCDEEMEESDTQISKYAINGKLGEGAYSVVCNGRDRGRGSGASSPITAGGGKDGGWGLRC